MPARIQCQRTAPIGPATVTVNGDHWPAKWAWAGLHFEDAHLRSRSPWCNDDYHLGVPWMHPDDYDVMHDDPDCWATYRVRPKRGWRSFVRIDGVWHVITRNQFGAFCSACQSPLSCEEDDWDECDTCGGEGIGCDDVDWSDDDA
jgi:hypothetical protein